MPSLEIRNSDDVVRTRLGASLFVNVLRATKELKRPDFQQGQMEMSGFEYSESGPLTTSVEEFRALFQSSSDLSGWDFPWNMWMLL